MASEHLKTYLDELSEKIEYITTNLTADTLEECMDIFIFNNIFLSWQMDVDDHVNPNQDREKLKDRKEPRNSGQSFMTASYR